MTIRSPWINPTSHAHAERRPSSPAETACCRGSPRWCAPSKATRKDVWQSSSRTKPKSIVQKWSGLPSDSRDIGCQAFCVEPRAIHFSEEGLFLQEPGGPRRIGLLYRFFELFDLKNIPKAELVMYAAKKGQVAVTPPYKPALEENWPLLCFIIRNSRRSGNRHCLPRSARACDGSCHEPGSLIPGPCLPQRSSRI